jgi:hypothetical protein
MRQSGTLNMQEDCVEENFEKAIFDRPHSNDFPEFLFSLLVKKSGESASSILYHFTVCVYYGNLLKIEKKRKYFSN